MVSPPFPSQSCPRKDYSNRPPSEPSPVSSAVAAPSPLSLSSSSRRRARSAQRLLERQPACPSVPRGLPACSILKPSACMCSSPSGNRMRNRCGPGRPAMWPPVETVLPVYAGGSRPKRAFCLSSFAPACTSVHSAAGLKGGRGAPVALSLAHPRGRWQPASGASPLVALLPKPADMHTFNNMLWKCYL